MEPWYVQFERLNGPIAKGVESAMMASFLTSLGILVFSHYQFHPAVVLVGPLVVAVAAVAAYFVRWRQVREQYAKLDADGIEVLLRRYE